ncbi:MAG: SdiA-regulated domain-containing protein [Rufibacter sp.]
MKRLKIFIWSIMLSTTVMACDASQADARGTSALKNEKIRKEKALPEPASPQVKVSQKWEVPDILREVSGIVYLGNNQFACIQDEAGVIFIYNTEKGQIERQITFGAAGDYEGIALAGNTAYVVRSDGRIFEVTNIHTQQNKVSEFTTQLNENHNVEGLAYDQKNNRLLLAIKGEEPGAPDFKGIYAFDLKAKQLSAQPVYKLSLKDPMLAKMKVKKKKGLSKVWQPSEIAIHPATGELYMTEATNPQIFILNPDGSIKKRFQLSKNEFYKPEGIAFGPRGELFISNEGKKEHGNILAVNLQ